MMASLFDSELNKSVLVLAMASALTACGGGSSSSVSDNDEEEHEHEGGRLFYSVSSASDISLYDQTNEEAPFTETAITTSVAEVELVLASSGLTAAMIDSGTLFLIDSGLEEHDDEEESDETEEEHNESPSKEPVTLEGTVTKLVATHEYFSVVNGANSTVINPEDGSVVESFSDVVYPTLVLTGGHYLIFTSGTNGATELAVVKANGNPVDGSVTSTCASGGITTSAQTEHLTQVLCGNGTLLSFVAEEGEADTSFTVSNTPESGVENLVATASEYDVIVGWSEGSGASKTLKLFKAGSSPADVSSAIDSSAILDVAALTSDENDVFGVLGSDGKFFALTFNAEGTELKIVDNDKFQLESGQTWSSSDRVLADSEAFIAINTESQTLYFIDGHDEEDYHLHSSESGDENLAAITSAVLAHVQEEHGEEGHDEEGHDHN